MAASRSIVGARSFNLFFIRRQKGHIFCEKKKGRKEGDFPLAIFGFVFAWFWIAVAAQYIAIVTMKGKEFNLVLRHPGVYTMAFISLFFLFS